MQLSYAVSGRSEHAKDCEAVAGPDPYGSALQRSSLHHLATTVAAYLRMDLVAAARAVRRAQQTGDADTDPPLAAAIVLWQARVLLAAGQVADAYVDLHVGPRAGHGAADPARHVAVPGAGRDRDPDGAAQRRAEGARRDRPAEPRRPMLAVAAARAYLALGDVDAAGARPATRPDRLGAPRPRCRCWSLRLLTSAKVAELGGDEAKAVEEVLRATGLAGPALAVPVPRRPGRCWPGCSAGTPRPRRRGRRSSLETRPTSRSARPRRRQSLAEPLTDRETAVLRRLATTMTTAEIGDELCVSINTIKTHIAAIYRKLPAAGRRDAVARARQLELL